MDIQFCLTQVWRTNGTVAQLRPKMTGRYRGDRFSQWDWLKRFASRLLHWTTSRSCARYKTQDLEPFAEKWVSLCLWTCPGPAILKSPFLRILRVLSRRKRVQVGGSVGRIVAKKSTSTTDTISVRTTLNLNRAVLPEDQGQVGRQVHHGILILG